MQSLPGKRARIILISICVLGVLSGEKNIEFDGERELMGGYLAPLTSSQHANVYYKRGRNHFRQALELAAEANGSDSSKRRASRLAKAHRRFAKSAAFYTDALRYARDIEPRPDYLPELYAELGEASRRTGDFMTALDAYDEALALAPARLLPEYGKAETLLALDRTVEVRDAYARLLKHAEISASAWGLVDDFMASLQRYVDVNAAQVDPAFAAWVHAQADELDDTVRWTLLEAGD